MFFLALCTAVLMHPAVWVQPRLSLTLLLLLLLCATVQVCDESQRERLLSRVRCYYEILKTSTFGKHIVNRLEKLLSAGMRIQVNSLAPSVPAPAAPAHAAAPAPAAGQQQQAPAAAAPAAEQQPAQQEEQVPPATSPTAAAVDSAPAESSEASIQA